MTRILVRILLILFIILLFQRFVFGADFLLRFNQGDNSTIFHGRVNQGSPVPLTVTPLTTPNDYAAKMAITPTPGASYDFEVRALNADNTPGPWSNTVRVIIPSSTPTVTPSATPTVTRTTTSTITATVTATRTRTPLPTPVPPNLYDVTGDGTVSALDAAKFLQMGDERRAICALRVVVELPPYCT